MISGDGTAECVKESDEGVRLKRFGHHDDKKKQR